MKIITTLLVSLMAFSFANAQNSNINYLNKNYEYGVMPSNVGSTDMQNAYTTWKTTYVESTCSNGSARIRFDDPAYTVSEGIAYGMLLSAYANDQELFNKLWSYYQINSNGNGVMNWKILGCTTVEGFGGATDAEIDVAIALIIAGNRFGNSSGTNYHNDAKTLIAAIKQHEVESGTFVLKPGDGWGGSQNTNPSYLAPGYFKVYGEFTNDQSFWNNVANKSYQILNANLSVNNAVDCLVSDWCKADGSYSDIVPWAYESGQTYFYDAARTPWRIATDYVWYGSSESASYTAKCRNFVSSKGGINQIKAGYTQQGTVIGNYQDPTFTGAFASAILSSTSQSEVNTAYTTLKNQTSSAYFASTLRVLYMYTMSGNLYNPLTDGDTPVDNSLSVTTTSQFPANGASQVIIVTSNVNWTVSENSSWLSVNRTSGSNNGNVTVTAAQNTNTSNRNATITISGGDITRSVTISQVGAEDTINEAPSVSISSPLNNSNETEGTAVQIAANANDSDGSVIQVEFFANGINVGVDYSTPYSINWNATVGSYALTAKATDNNGATRISSSITITIDPSATGGGNCESLTTWTPSAVFPNAGAQVVYNGNIYQNNWYTSNQNPETNSGQWRPWSLIGTCTESANKNILGKEGNLFEVTAFPNPYTETITIKANNTNQEIGSVELVSLSGRMIIQKTVNASETTLNNLEGLANGVYLVKVLNAREQIIKSLKMVKE